MSERIWATSQDGNIQYLSLTEKYLEETLNLLQATFFVRETISIVCGLPDDVEGRNELRNMCTKIAKCGISIIAIDKQLNKIAGVALNHLQVEGVSFYEKFIKTCKQLSSRDYLQCMIDMDYEMNLFEKINSSCYIELLFLATCPEYQGREIATNLTEITIDMGSQIKEEKRMKLCLDEQVLSVDPIPGAIIAIFTSNISQKIGTKCGFETISRISYKDIKRNKQSFYELLGKKQGEIIATYKQL